MRYHRGDPAATPAMSATHTDSWYAATARRLVDHPPLTGAQRADAVVIGAGYTGLSTALHLAERGYAVTVLEAKRVGWGASGRNGGHVGTGQRADQQTLERLVGKQRAHVLWDMGLESVELVSRLVDHWRIDCELKKGNLELAHSETAARELREDVDHLQAVYDFDAIRYVERNEVDALTSAQGFFGGSVNTAARHLHPLNYCLGLAAAAANSGATIHENSREIGRAHV
jgi:gamma-glutamylputrescine oxidase